MRDLKELRETTRACTTCFGCEGDLDDLVAEHRDLFGHGAAEMALDLAARLLERYPGLAVDLAG